MLGAGTDVMILSEHQMWPYELHKPNEFDTLYQGSGKSDPRLTNTLDTTTARGFGGVGMLWKNSLGASEISNINSDRICGIRVKKGADETWITTVGVYLPYPDLGIDLHRDCLSKLEKVISGSECMGPAIVAGDFNAHLGSICGPRVEYNSNLQGVLLEDLLDTCKLHAVSLCESVSGPNYTYKSGDTCTTVDYILTDIEASSCIDSCGMMT